MDTALLAFADILLLVIVALLLLDYAHKHHRQLQERWFKVRRKVFKR